MELFPQKRPFRHFGLGAVHRRVGSDCIDRIRGSPDLCSKAFVHLEGKSVAGKVGVGVILGVSIRERL